MATATPPTISPNIPGTPGLQYIRTCKLLVTSDLFVVPNPGQTLDLSQFRIKFSIKRTNIQTTNTADIKIYNLSPQKALAIQRQYTRVFLQAGYEGNFGTIFAGTIKQVIIGRESATDTYLQIIAGDGDLAYNYAIVAVSIPKGTTPQDDINACAQAMSKLGTTAGKNAKVTTTQTRYRGKTLFGNARNYLRTAAKTTQTNWSIQDEQISFVPIQGYLPGTAVVLNSTNGMIGSHNRLYRE